MSIKKLGFACVALWGATLIPACGSDEKPAPDLGTRGGSDASASVDSGAGGDQGVAPPDLSSPSGHIDAVRMAADGRMSTPDGGMLNLLVDEVLVTYVKPGIGGDPAGFFVQAEMDGPALFVAVDPATISPAPTVGDKVTFTVETVNAASKVSGIHEATGIAGYTRLSQGNPLGGLVQELSGASDLESSLTSYEDELIKLSGTLVDNPASAGTGYVAAPITTAGIPSSDGKLKLRVPATLADTLNLEAGCSFTVTSTPLWLNNTTAQPSAWVAADITVADCARPKVLSAVAADANTVVVTFDHQIKPGSLAADGSQFTFDGGLSATGAAASGRKVTVTTSAQTVKQVYQVTVAKTLTDLRDHGIDPANNTTTFSGYLPPAVLRINELNPGVTTKADLIELRVVAKGNIGGLLIQKDVGNLAPTLLTTLPPIDVDVDQLIVVHLKTDGTSETAHLDDCKDAVCYPTAWDVFDSANGNNIGNSARTVVVREPSGRIQDAVAFYSILRAGFAKDVSFLQSPQGPFPSQWKPADCSGAPCDETTVKSIVVFTGAAKGVPAVSFKDGYSIGRISNTDTDTAADWAPGPDATHKNTFGLPNP
jgi:hypothetical protein